MAVYFIQDGDNVKIGSARDPRKRLESLQGGNPNQLTLIAVQEGGLRDEMELHKRFDEHRIGRSEWFRFVDSLKDYALTSMAGLNITTKRADPEAYREALPAIAPKAERSGENVAIAHARLPKELFEEVVKLAGEQGVSSYIRKLLMDKVVVTCKKCDGRGLNVVLK